MRYATCHPDKQHMALGMCSSCYWADWRKKNTEKSRATVRRYYSKNPQKSLIRWTNRFNTNVSFRVAHNLRRRVNRALRGSRRSESTLSMLGCSVEEFKKYLEAQFQPGMSWQNYGKWHIDHKKPCAKFNLTKLSDQKKCFHYANLQPLWAVENLSKGSKEN